MTPIDTTPEQRATARRDAVALANANALLDVMREHNIYIKASDFPNWRPTLRISGEIPGVASSVTIIATNGLTGYFLYDGSERYGEVLYGHIQRFTGTVETLHSIAEKRSSSMTKEPKTKKPKRQSHAARAIEILERLRILRNENPT